MNPDHSSKYESLDRKVFHRRAAIFNRMDLELLDTEQLSNEILHVLTPPNRNVASIPTNTLTYPKGTSFWRARPLDSSDHVLPLKSMNKLADAWEAPVEKIGLGRLNKQGEPLLYTCIGEPLSVADEIHVKDDEPFLLIRYRSNVSISLTSIGLPMPLNHLSEKAAENAALINDFLGEQFLRKKRKGFREYYLSEFIAKTFADLPPDFHHGWAYPSVTTQNAINATFRPADAHSKLQLEGVAYCSVSRSFSFTTFKSKAYTGCESSDDNFIWYRQGSPFQQRVFPEFNSSN